MSNQTKNGVATPQGGAAAPKDTAKGVAALAVAATKTEAQPKTENPIAERLRKINDLHKLTEKRKRLVDAADKVNHFEESLNGEDDSISLESRGDSLEISKADAVREVVNLLRANVQKSVEQVDAEILSTII